MTQAYKTMGEAYREMYAEFTDAHIGKLKKAYATLKGKRLSLDNNKKLTMIVNKMTKDQLVKVMNADIPFLSTSAMSTLVIKHKLKYPEIDKLRVKEEIGEEEETEEAYKLPRQLKNPKKEVMVSKDKYGTIVIDKTDWPKYKAKGWTLAEELELTETSWKIIYKTYPLHHHGEKSRVVKAKDKDDAKSQFRRTSPDTKIINIVKEEVELDEGKYSQYSSLLVQKGKLIGKGFIPQSMTVKRIDKEIEKEKKKLGIKEDLDEGKYSQYSSLLVQKGKLLGKGFIPTSTTVTRIDKEIAKELKKLGIKEDLEEGRMKDLHLYIQQKKSAEWIAKKMKLDVKTVKALMSSVKYEFDPDKDKNKEKIKEAEDDESEDEKVKKAKDKADKDVQVALLKKKIAALSTQEAVDLYFNNVDSGTKILDEALRLDYVKQYTQNNDHFGARVYIAQQMRDKEMESIYKGLETIHRKYYSYAGNHAVITRDKLEKVLYSKINGKWGRKLGNNIIDNL